ncbi:Protein nud1 [Neophaeococcomyces mojaviensis]|uniref:Protein nud1 n=1 Tax=Neophaeococcomyces mojaviensis TaxID=3383035 RepID=A0ACC3A2Z4_9EURO|nr:Protein nud1 [Knufia sp. JES_112]
MEPWLQGLSDEDWPSSPSTSTRRSPRSASTVSSRASSVRRHSVRQKLEFETKDLFTPSKLENVFVPPSRSFSSSSRRRSRSLNATLPTLKEVEQEEKTSLSDHEASRMTSASFPSNLSTGTLQKPSFLRSRRRYLSRSSSPRGLTNGNESRIPQPLDEDTIATPVSTRVATTSANVVESKPTVVEAEKATLPPVERTIVHAESFSAVDSSVIHNMTPARPLKRRDALPGNARESASPETLASRAILRPSGSRRTSEVLDTVTDQEESQLTEDLAAELESFAKSVHATKIDVRKPSLTTRDYMEEANKVMEFIRARGKPIVPTMVNEELFSSGLKSDETLDADVDNESTKEEFERPPSRDAKYYNKPADRRHAVHDETTANHLKKFQDTEDLDLLTNASAFATPHPVDNQAADEASMIELPADEEVEEPNNDQSYVSDPAGMRILNQDNNSREHLSGDADAQNSPNIHSDSTRRTIVTTSSTASGQRGMISSGTVSIPDRIGAMTFDHEKKVWIKEHLKPQRSPALTVSPDTRAGNKDISEADPFESIPDLSIDELREASLKRGALLETDQDEKTKSVETAQFDEVQNMPQQEHNDSQVHLGSYLKSSLKVSRRKRPSENNERPSSKDSGLSQHEERLHNGLPSNDLDPSRKQQPRVVTIAFSSPIASEIPYVEPPSMSDIELDDPNYLPLDDEGSTLATSPAKPVEEPEYLSDYLSDYDSSPHRPVLGLNQRYKHYRAMTNQRRTVSRIEEYDEGYDTNDNKEDQDDHRELSLVHISTENKENYDENQELSMVHIKHQELTPLPKRQAPQAKRSVKNNFSILSLTPLSEFTLHQVDKLNHPEDSFIAPRANPKTLRQAHGSHVLVEDALVKAITDAEPTELFWEQLKKLSLQNSGLSTLYGLKEYCSSLQTLDVTGNRISQVADLPVTLRSLYISSNMLNDLTSWTHLHNLQTLDVSGNQLESLECFSGLMHLRKLNAKDNRIRSIEGILDMDGLVSLDLSGNDITEADFYSCDLVSLETLDLSRNNLLSVKNLDRLPELRYADFTENVLKELIITGNKTVRRLDTLCLGKNLLKNIDLTAFPSLQRLNIDENIITKIIGLAEAENLTILSARAQAVEEPSNLINDILTTSHECTEIYISSNTLPEGNIQLPRKPNYTLRCLEIASCGIKDLPPNFGDYFPNMRVLNLNFNAFSTESLESLLGMCKLRTLLLAKNRIKKMRRTCLILKKLEALKRLDLRDNPLTVGFYDPLKDARFEPEGAKARADYRLPERMVDADKSWISRMDEPTCSRRAMTHLMIAHACWHIVELDGLAFDRELIMSEKNTWMALADRGVLKASE